MKQRKNKIKNETYQCVLSSFRNMYKSERQKNVSGVSCTVYTECQKKLYTWLNLCIF